MDYSAITCALSYSNLVIDSYDEETKTILTNFNEKNITYIIQNLYILLAFLLITIALLIAASIYCYLINVEPSKNIYYYFMSQITN